MSKSRLHNVWRFSLKLLLCASLFCASSAMAQCENWGFESIVPGSKPAGAISSCRLPRACYSSGFTLKYCYKDSAGWHHETIADTYLGHAWANGVMIDPLDRFHVVLSGSSIDINPWISYKYRDEQGWHSYFLGYYYPWGGDGARMVLDATMSPHVVYEDQGVLHYWYLGDSGAETGTVDADNSNNSISISISGAGRPCVVYEKVDLGEIWFAVLGPLGWQTQVILPEMTDVSLLRLVHDSFGEPHLCFYDPENVALKYATKSAGEWILETVDGSGDAGGHDFLAVDTQGYPHISYYDAANGDLKYAFKNEEGWQITRVDTAGNVGESTTIRLDEYGNTYFFYHDVTNNMIKWAFPSLSMSTTLEDGNLTLNWSTVGGVEEFWLYGAENDPWFEPELEWPFGNRVDVLDPGVTQYSTTVALGDPDSNWTYLVIAVDDQHRELARSNRVGEWDWGMGIP